MERAVPKAVSIGEGMVEIRVLDPDRASIGFGGDTMNVAIYLARLGVGVDYATALGDDAYSDAMLDLLKDEGVGTGLVRRLPGRLPGLYTIRTDEKGERTFHYWRDRSPARELFDLPDADRLAGDISGFDLIYFSGITLSLYGEAGRQRLLSALDAARARGARVAFDSNYRPRNWPDVTKARAVIGEMLGRTDIALPTLDDEQALFGDADAAACARRLRAAGVAEVAVKLGAEGAWADGPDGAFRVPIARRVTPVDTTAAGDSFNAGYLQARLAGVSQGHAVRAAEALAAEVIRHRGAVIPRDAMPDLGRREPGTDKT